MMKLIKSKKIQPEQRETLQRMATSIHDFNPAMRQGNDQRFQRWVKRKTWHAPMVTDCCGEKKHPTKKQHDLVYVDKLEQFSSQLFDDIERRKNAIKNWQKLRILIVLFQICGNKAVGKGKKKFVEEKKQSFSLRERIAPYIIDPKNRYKVAWDLMIGIIYLLSYILDPIAAAFMFEPL